MDTENKNEVTTVDPLKEESKEIINQIIQAESKEDLEALYDKFNINNTKKNVTRIDFLNDLLDSVNQQAHERFTKRADEVSNKEILDYMNAIQNQIERSQKIVSGIKEVNAVQVNHNNTVNINVDSQNLDRETRDTVTAFITEFLASKNLNKDDLIPVTKDEDIPVIKVEDK